jgi:hypothetical protein
MRYARLDRYDDSQLDSMLYSYSRIAELHGRSGHYALAKWAKGMQTHITVELNRRYAAAEAARDRQLAIPVADIDTYGTPLDDR